MKHRLSPKKKTHKELKNCQTPAKYRIGPKNVVFGKGELSSSSFFFNNKKKDDNN